MPLSPSRRPAQAALAERFAAFRALARPPCPTPWSAAEAVQPVRRARRASRSENWPLCGSLVRSIAALAHQWRTPGLRWREKLLMTPFVGTGAFWLWSLLTPVRARRQLNAQGATIARLEAELARLSRALEDEQRSRRQQGDALAQALAATTTAAPGGALPPAVYLALEDRLRGDREEIAARCAAYLSFAHAAAATGLPAADIGCGRGEWLGLLSGAGITAIGVDGNAAMVAACRARQLVAEEADGLTWLLAREPGSLALVSLFHVVEHLPTGTLWSWLQAAATALAPNGILLIETPNPENLQVATYSFWFDPTHLKPLPPPLLDFLVRQTGLETQEILRFSPWPEMAQTDDAYPPYLRKLLFCGQDYGLVARKIATAAP